MPFRELKHDTEQQIKRKKYTHLDCGKVYYSPIFKSKVSWAAKMKYMVAWKMKKVEFS